MNKGDTVQFIGTKMQLSHWGVDSAAITNILDNPVAVIQHNMKHGLIVKFETAGEWYIDRTQLMVIPPVIIDPPKLEVPSTEDQVDN